MVNDFHHAFTIIIQKRSEGNNKSEQQKVIKKKQCQGEESVKIL